jgi:hypothetical protein
MSKRSSDFGKDLFHLEPLINKEEKPFEAFLHLYGFLCYEPKPPRLLSWLGALGYVLRRGGREREREGDENYIRLCQYKF